MSLTLSDCLDQHLEMRGVEIEMKAGVGRQPLLEGGKRRRRRYFSHFIKLWYHVMVM